MADPSLGAANDMVRRIEQGKGQLFLVMWFS